MTKEEIMLRLMRGDFDRMSNLPRRIVRRMKKKGWYYATPGVWLSLISKTDDDNSLTLYTVRNGDASWKRDILECLAEAGMI